MTRENKTSAWITCLDCGSRWDRVYGDEDYLDNIGIPLMMNNVNPETCDKYRSTMKLRKCPVTSERFWACEKFPKCQRFLRTMLDAEEMVVREDKPSRKHSTRDSAKSTACSSSLAHSVPSCPTPKRGTRRKEAPNDEEEMAWTWEKAEEE